MSENTNILDFQFELDKVETLKKKYYTALSELEGMSDGYTYLTNLRRYGTIKLERHENHICPLNLIHQYSDGRGIVDVYTNNPNALDLFFMTDGTVYSMTKDEIEAFQAKNGYLSI